MRERTLRTREMMRESGVPYILLLLALDIDLDGWAAITLSNDTERPKERRIE